jgi:hypothetical protein
MGEALEATSTGNAIVDGECEARRRNSWTAGILAAGLVVLLTPFAPLLP